MLLPITRVIKALFGIALDSKRIIGDIGEKRKKARGTKNRILFEIEFNMKLIFEHYLKKKVEPSKIIKELRIKNLSKAIDEGFDFEKIKKGTIGEDLTGDVGFFRPFIGDNCETLLRKIRLATEDLKLWPDFYDLEERERINVGVRLQNLGKRYLLFTRFLNL